MNRVNDNVNKRKVLICLGNGRGELANTNHNIGWQMANYIVDKEYGEWSSYKNKSGEIIAMHYTTKDGKLLIKPLSKNPMDYDAKKIEEQSKNFIHKPDYYGYGTGYETGYGYADYNSAGIAVQELLQEGFINDKDDLNVVSDNKDININNTNRLEDSRYFVDNQNNGTKDILMRNDIKFHRIDLGTKQKSNTKMEHGGVHDEISQNVDYDKIYESIKEALKYKPKNLANMSNIKDRDSLSEAISFFTNPESKYKDIDFINFILKSHNNKKDPKGINFNMLKFFYAMADCRPIFIKNIIKNDGELRSIIEKLDQFSQKELSNKIGYNTALPLSKYIEEKTSDQKAVNIITPYFDQMFSSPVSATRNYNANFKDIKSFGVDIFDKKHYINKQTFNALCEKVDKLVKNSDSLFLMPNDFNIRDEFKRVNGFNKEIDLSNATNDVVRSFWESYIINKAAKLNKPVSGVCGGHQVLSNALGFFVCRLSNKNSHKELAEQDKAHSPTRDVDFEVYSQHTQGVPMNINDVSQDDINFYGKEKIKQFIEHNEALLKELNLSHAPASNPYSTTSIKGLRLNNSGLRYTTQYHPENMSIYDPTNQEVFEQMIKEPLPLNNQMKKAIENFSNLMKNVVFKEKNQDKVVEFGRSQSSERDPTNRYQNLLRSKSLDNNYNYSNTKLTNEQWYLN